MARCLKNCRISEFHEYLGHCCEKLSGDKGQESEGSDNEDEEL